MNRIGKYQAAAGLAGGPSDTAPVVKKAPEQEEVEKALKAFDDYRKVPGNNDHIVLLRLLGNIHDANEKFAKTNKAASDAIDVQVANAIVNEISPENKVVLLQQHTNLRFKRQEAVKKLEEKKKAVVVDTTKGVTVAKEDVSKTQLNAMNKRAGLTEAVDAKDNNPRQAEALLKGLAILKDNKGAQALLKRLTTDNNGDNYIKLSSLNTGALLEWVAGGMKLSNNGWKGVEPVGYRTNGMDNGETLALQKLADSLSGNQDVVALAKNVRAFYDAGQTSEDWLIVVGKKEAPGTGAVIAHSEVLSYLSTYREGTFYEFKKIDDKGNMRLESADRSFFTPYGPGELQGYFGKLSYDELIVRVKDIIRLGGGSLTKDFPRPAALFIEMKENPVLRANYIRGLNFVAMTPNRWKYFLNGSLEVGVPAEKATKLVDFLKDKKNLDGVRAGFEKGATENKKAVEANQNLTPDQRKNILAGIDKFTAEMSNDEKLRSVTYDGFAVITNKGAAVGGGATWSLESMLADSVSAGGSVGTDYKGGFGAALSLAFTKELYQSNKADFGVHYGLMAASGGLKPFVGAHGSYEDFMASVTKGPAFVNVFLGMRVGKNTDTIRDLEGLSGAQKEIYQLAARKKIETISVKGLVNNPSITARMDTTIQSMLKLNGYRSDLSQEAAYAILYSAVIEAMNQEVLVLRRESNDNGWVMKQIGINFGKIAGLSYILPGFQIGREDMRVELQEGKAKLSSTIALKDKDAKELLASSGYTFSESFDAVKQEKKFVIAGKAKAAPTVIVPSTIAGQGAGKVFVEYKGDNVTITAGRNVELVADRSLDGKITISVKDKGEFEKVVTNTTISEELKGVDLSKSGGFEKLMQTKDARIALASAFFWGNAELTQFLAAYHKADMSDAKVFVEAVTPKLSALLSKNKGNKAIALLITSLGQKDQNPQELMSKIVRVRTGFMTDVSNTSNLKVDSEGVVNFSVKEGVKKNWESRKASKALIELTGAIDLSKFDGLMNTDEKTYKAVSGMLGSVNTANLLGVVAGYKGGKEAHGFSVIPKGMMSVAQAGGKNLIEEMVAGDATEKATALGLISVYQPKMWDVIIKNITTSIENVTGTKGVLSVDIITLLTTGKATINGKEVTSTAKFYRLAFGECLNTPSYGVDLGVVTSGKNTEEVKDGSSMRGSRVEQYEVANNRTRYGVDSKEFRVLMGTIADPKSETPDPSTKPRVDPNPTSVDTRPVADRGPVVPGATTNAPPNGTAPVGQPIAAPAGGTAAAPRPPNVVAPLPTANTQLPANPVGSGPGVAPPPSRVVDPVVPRVSAGTIATAAEGIRVNPDR